MRVAPAVGCERVGDTLLIGDCTGEFKGDDARPLHRNKMSITCCSELSKNKKPHRSVAKVDQQLCCWDQSFSRLATQGSHDLSCSYYLTATFRSALALFCPSLQLSPFAVSAVCPQGAKSIRGNRALVKHIVHDIGFLLDSYLWFRFFLAGLYKAFPSARH